MHAFRLRGQHYACCRRSLVRRHSGFLWASILLYPTVCHVGRTRSAVALSGRRALCSAQVRAAEMTGPKQTHSLARRGHLLSDGDCIRRIQLPGRLCDDPGLLSGGLSGVFPFASDLNASVVFCACVFPSRGIETAVESDETPTTAHRTGSGSGLPS